MTLRERFDIMNVLRGLPPRQRDHYSHLQLMTHPAFTTSFVNREMFGWPTQQQPTTEQLKQNTAAIRRAEARTALRQWAKERRA